MSRMSQVVAEWQAHLADPSVRFTLGRKERDRHQKPPRVAVLPVGGPLESPDRVGRQDLGEIDEGATRTLFDRKQQTLVQCWGVDFDSTEQLLHNVIAAIRASALGSVRLVSHEWISETEGVAGDDLDGDCAQIECEVIFPVTDAIKPLAVLPFAFPCKVFWNGPVYGVGYEYNSGRVYGPGEAVCCD